MKVPQNEESGAEDIMDNADKSSLPVVVIIGGGFGGLSAARKLANAPVKIVLIDRSNHHLFQPLLYQVATAGLSPADIAKPIRSILSGQKNVGVVFDEVTGIDVAKKLVHTGDLTFGYDYLIVAAGARHSYFGHPEWEKFAPGLKSIDDATAIRRRILTAFEIAEKSTASEDMQAALTFVVVGAGPTGVEMAGAIAELARFTLAKDFRRIDPTSAKVLLIEAGPRVLPSFAPELSSKALTYLENMHVDVRLNHRVEDVGDGYVIVNGEDIITRTVIWAAGNAATPLAKDLGAETDKQGRMLVKDDLSVPGHPEIYAIGDMAFIKDKAGKPVPGVSPAAMQEGKHAADNIVLQIHGKPTRPFYYFDKGSLATIGRHTAIADLHGIHLGGFIGWLIWAFVHLFFLIGFKNRLFVFFNWAWAYFKYNKGSRLITGHYSGELRLPPKEPIYPDDINKL
ncbi:MAG: NAD(P)/FAD-dependent oxidoreductase, partial [Chthoniobacterales bacterium]